MQTLADMKAPILSLEYVTAEECIYYNTVKNMEKMAKEASEKLDKYREYLSELEPIKTSLVNAYNGLSSSASQFLGGGYTDDFNSNGNTISSVASSLNDINSNLDTVISTTKSKITELEELLDRCVTNHNTAVDMHNPWMEEENARRAEAARIKREKEEAERAELAKKRKEIEERNSFRY